RPAVSSRDARGARIRRTPSRRRIALRPDVCGSVLPRSTQDRSDSGERSRRANRRGDRHEHGLATGTGTRAEIGSILREPGTSPGNLSTPHQDSRCRTELTRPRSPIGRSACRSYNTTVDSFIARAPTATVDSHITIDSFGPLAVERPASIAALRNL